MMLHGVENRPNQRAICVLGMHRSGTSCLTGIMQRFGVELGEVFESNPFNKKGNREHPRIMALNEAVLEYNGGAWDAPVEVMDWSSEHVHERTEILADISGRGDGLWGFKDPRFLLTRPFWLEVMNPAYIATFRHPLRVALSLKQRSNMPFDDGVALWYAYNSRLWRILESEAPPLVNFDLDPQQYLEDVTAKLLNLGLPEARRDQALAFFDSQLRHQTTKAAGQHPLPSKVRDLYSKLLDYHSGGSMRKAVAQLTDGGR